MSIYKFIISVGILLSCHGTLLANGLKLNEIQFQSVVPDLPVMIELSNDSPDPIDLSGYVLKDCEDNAFEFPAGARVDANSLAVVAFGAETAVRSLRRSGVPWFFGSAELNRRIFRERRAQCCTLFSAKACLPEQQIDQVSWGHWAFTDQVFGNGRRENVTVPTIMLFPGDLGLAADESLARLPAARRESGSPPTEWVRQCPGDVSIGSPNPWPRPQVFPQSRLNHLTTRDADAQDLTISGPALYTPGPPGGALRIQVARDPRFVSMFFDGKSEDPSMDVKVPVGVFFWRMRWEVDGRFSGWQTDRGCLEIEP